MIWCQRVLIYILGGIFCWLLLIVWSQRYIREFHLQIMRNGLEHHARLTQVLLNLDDSISESEIDNDLPPRTSPPSKLDLGPFEVHSTEQNRVLVT